jgi:hypothetical protein
LLRCLPFISRRGPFSPARRDDQGDRIFHIDVSTGFFDLLPYRANCLAVGQGVSMLN